MFTDSMSLAIVGEETIVDVCAVESPGEGWELCDTCNGRTYIECEDTEFLENCVVCEGIGWNPPMCNGCGTRDNDFIIDDETNEYLCIVCSSR